MDNRLDLAIRKWAKLTDAYVNDWNIEQWVKVLTDRPEPTEKILDHMHYLVTNKHRPHLTTLLKSLENGLPRDWKDRQTMQEISTDGAKYFRKVREAMGQDDHWSALRKCIDYGRELAPGQNWESAIRECDAKKRGRSKT